MDRYKTIHEYFQDNLPENFKVSKELYVAIRKFRIMWSQKSEEYMEFLGGNTLGVQAIRFSQRDESILFEEILEFDLDKLIQNVKYIKGIDPKWAVAGNPIYLTLVYLMHLFIISKLPNNIRIDAVKELYFIYAYKVMGSLLSHYFKFQTSEAIAKATYEKLSNRYLIKQLDSWQDVFEYRTLDLLPPDGIHYKRLVNLDTDGIVRITNDLQGRIRELVKNIYVIMIEIIEHNDKINSTSAVESNEEGADSLKDLTTRPDKYINYLHKIVNLPEFVNNDLIYLVKQYVPTVDEGHLKTSLSYIVNNVKVKQNSKDDFVSISIIHTLNYIQTKGIFTDYTSHTSSIMKYMRGYWSSSSVKHKEVIHIKKYLYNIVKKAINKKTGFVIKSVVISILIYTFVRALYKQDN